jgi:hypothetical protein
MHKIKLIRIAMFVVFITSSHAAVAVDPKGPTREQICLSEFGDAIKLMAKSNAILQRESLDVESAGHAVAAATLASTKLKLFELLKCTPFETGEIRK